MLTKNRVTSAHPSDELNFLSGLPTVTCAERVSLHDETFRDGLQSPSVVDPSIHEKLEVLHELDALGVATINVALPAAGPRALESAEALCREIANSRLTIRPCIAARTKIEDIQPAVDLMQKTGIPIRVMAFVPSSPIRTFTQGWTLDTLKRLTTVAIDFACKHELKITYVTEDTTRSPPSTLRALFRIAIDHGADRLCLCDTCGHATPDGASSLVRFTRDFIGEEAIGIDWHGHDDRGLALVNALAAANAGADRLHGCVLGIGERVGNASLDLLHLNLALDRGETPEVERLLRLCGMVASAMHREVPFDYPLCVYNLAEHNSVTKSDTNDVHSRCSIKEC